MSWPHFLSHRVGSGGGASEAVVEAVVEVKEVKVVKVEIELVELVV